MLYERISFLNIDEWLSLVERCVRDAEAAGSNPVASTAGNRRNKGFSEIIRKAFCNLPNVLPNAFSFFLSAVAEFLFPEEP